LNLLVSEPAETERSLVIAEVRPGEHGEPGAREPDAVGGAILEAQRDRLTRGERKQFLVRELCWRREPDKKVKRRNRLRFAHRGQIDQLLDRAPAEQRPDPLVLVTHFCVRWMRRPIDAAAAKVGKSDLDRANTAAERRVYVNPEAGDPAFLDGAIREC